MKNALFIAIFVCCSLSLANCESFSGDLRIADSSPHTYNGLTVGGTFYYMASGPVRVNIDATIQGNLEFNGSGEVYVTGVLTVRGALHKRGSGNLHADGGIVNIPNPK